jgi:hypothetical protein
MVIVPLIRRPPMQRSRPPLLPMLVWIGLLTASPMSVLAIPPPDDIPEEVLRTEVIVEARSPFDGAPISAADYALLQAQLQDPNYDPAVNPNIAQLIQLLQFRRVLRPVVPFLR